ncbi:MAG TPA: flagellar basal body rod protein FlgB [Micavibrio sp.]|nr:flagellar basal body rod protein FlgB [Pseudomonadota bacterium]MEC8663854.1 flagellar basal body rod protein FlgB [Pseudomonadota bacterium]HIF24679.1 flagellar basal body rod protein FlgB [Micavibrio sp.]HIL29613.1 flagellar basal body rod protein FlgB [Micavibrio sp.]
MTTQNIGLLKAMTAKMGYLDQRQRVIAQNVANSDTPGYIPRDLTKVDFGRVMAESYNSKILRQETTDNLHMPSHREVADPKNRDQKTVYETAPAGNAVIMEEQMLKSTETTTDYNLMTTLYQKNISMMRTALGTGR